MDNQGPFAGENPYRSSSSTAANKAQYEDNEWLQRYLHLHYPEVDNAQAFPSFIPKEAIDFPKRCADLLIQSAQATGAPTRRALDLGCATGGSTFALARVYSEVHGLELSSVFVQAAQQLQSEGSMAYEIKAEGDVFLPLVATIPSDIDRSRATFAVGDALALPSTLGNKPTTHSFDAVLLANVLCRLPDPRAALTGIAGAERGVIAPGGLLMLTTPFSWKAEFTPKNMWLGGRKNADGVTISSLEELKMMMTSLGYDLIESKDMPLVIRQHHRLHELIGAHATVWRRRLA